MTLIQECRKVKQVKMKLIIETIRRGYKMFTENFTKEPTTVELESTNPIDKGKIPREWRHNATYPENIILGKIEKKI